MHLMFLLDKKNMFAAIAMFLRINWVCCLLTGMVDTLTICANISNNQLNNPTCWFKFLEANFGPPQMAPFYAGSGS